MKSKLLLVAMLLSAFAFSQDSAFHIKDYKYRTPGFRALALNFDFSGSYSNNNANNVNTERRNQTILGPVSAEYFRIKSTEKQLLQTNLSISTQYSSFSIKDPQRNFRNTSFGSDFRWQILSRNYRNNQWFLEWGNELHGRLETNKIGAQAFPTHNTEISGNNSAIIGVGKGRLEWVQDAQMALYILNDLESQNLLDRKPTAEEANVFSQLITDINNRRIFDSRRRRIYELSRIDSFLKTSGLVTQTDIRHFTTVNDNWAFAINPFRQSGAAWFVRLKPGVSLTRNRSTDKQSPQPNYNQQQSKSFYFTPQIGYEVFRPLNLKWQQNFSIVVSYNGEWLNQKYKQVQSTSENVVNNDYYGGSVSIETFYGIGYYPNTRTQITTNIGVWGSKTNDRWQLTPSVDLSANYFIGYRTYLSGQLSASYYFTDFDNGITKNRSDMFAGNFSVRLSHYIF